MYNIDCIHQQNAIKLMSYVSNFVCDLWTAYSKRPHQYFQNLKRGCSLVSLAIIHIQSTLVLQAPWYNKHPDNTESGQQLNLAAKNFLA